MLIATLRALSWRVAAVDVPGMVITGGVNAALVALAAVGVLVYRRSSWFTDEVFHLGRGPNSISGVFLFVLGAALVWWAAAWAGSGESSWRWQNAAAVCCWVLTVFHAVGCVSLFA